MRSFQLEALITLDSTTGLEAFPPSRRQLLFSSSSVVELLLSSIGDAEANKQVLLPCWAIQLRSHNLRDFAYGLSWPLKTWLGIGAVFESFSIV